MTTKINVENCNEILNNLYTCNCFNFYLIDDNLVIINFIMSTLYVLVCIQCNFILEKV